MTLTTKEAARVEEVAIEVVSPDWLYQTTINDISVTVKQTEDIGGYVYVIVVEQAGCEQCTKFHENQAMAIAMADLMRDIYYHGLVSDLLWH